MSHRRSSGPRQVFFIGKDHLSTENADYGPSEGENLRIDRYAGCDGHSLFGTVANLSEFELDYPSQLEK